MKERLKDKEGWMKWSNVWMVSQEDKREKNWEDLKDNDGKFFKTKKKKQHRGHRKYSVSQFIPRNMQRKYIPKV